MFQSSEFLSSKPAQQLRFAASILRGEALAAQAEGHQERYARLWERYEALEADVRYVEAEDETERRQ